MIRKLSHIIFASLIVLSTTGLTVSKHYCGDKLRSTSIITEIEPCCDIPEGCCHNESEVYIVDDSFSVTSFMIEFTEGAISLPLIGEVIINSFYNNRNNAIWIDHPPPPNIEEVILRSQSFLL